MNNKIAKSLLKVFLVAIILLKPLAFYAQDVDARSPHPKASSGQQKKAEKKKVKQQKQLEKAIEKGKKRHLKLQAKQTKKMIRKSKHSSKRYNENKREFFLKRWFRKKNH